MAAPALDSRLADVAALLERRGWAAELWDPEWRLAWVTRGLKETIGEHDEERLGYGRHWLECRLNEAWRRTVTRSHHRADAHRRGPLRPRRDGWRDRTA